MAVLDNTASGAASRAKVPKKPSSTRSTYRPSSARSPRPMSGGGPFRPISIPEGVVSRPRPSAPRGSGVGTTPTGTVASFADSGGNINGGSVNGGGMSQADWLAQDAEFNDTRAGLEREFQNLIAQLAKQRGDYELDTSNAKRNLGWDDENKAWNQKDKLTGYGNSFQNQQGDFASRGMLDSSLYGGALNDLNRGFERQRGDIETALQNFIAGQEMDKSQAEAAKIAAITAAQRQALMRMGAGLNL